MQRLLSERNNLKEEYEELRFAQLNQSNMTVEGSPSAAGVDTLDMIPYDFRYCRLDCVFVFPDNSSQ